MSPEVILSRLDDVHVNLTPQPRPDKAEMRSALDAMFAPDDVIELRAFHKGKKRVDAGYFDGEHREDLVNAAATLNASGAAVYVTLNRIDPQLLGRCCNRVEPFASATVTDANVIHRRWLMLDFDPVRPKDTSATNAQVEAAKACARICYQALKAEGWPTPVTVESGNGMHLYYAIDLPNDPETTALIKGALAGLAARFDTDAVKGDQSVVNAGRITKLCGTVATKGDHTPDMPWRLSRLVSGTDRDVVVTADQLRALHPKGNGADPMAGNAGGRGEIGRFLTRVSHAARHRLRPGHARGRRPLQAGALSLQPGTRQGRSRDIPATRRAPRLQVPAFLMRR
jgi:hypothetical protein